MNTVDIASGDDDPTDGDLETFNQLFPLGHAYFGYIDVIGRQNIIDVSPTVSTKVAGGATLRQTVKTGSSYASQSELPLTFGLGGDSSVKGIEVVWPNGRTERLPGSEVAIAIRDRGIGIARDDLPQIFEPYFTGKRTGHGLGLAITKNIVESLGGSITASSETRAGTEIRIVLPEAGTEGEAAGRTAGGVLS